MKKILITNDDGYDSKGLKALVEALDGLADITVVAPSSEKSACSHSITLTRPLSFISVDDDFYKLDDGTPSDCIYLALHSIFDKLKPDLVISGINHGSNMGEDITYSGTAAGAMEGILHGVNAIAISQVMDFSKPVGDFALAKKVIRSVVSKIFDEGFPLPERQFLNINIPRDVADAEMCVTYAGYRYYANDAHLHRNPRGMEYYWLGLHPLEYKQRDGVEGLCDFDAIQQKMVSITPVQVDLSAYKSMDKLNKWL